MKFLHRIRFVPRPASKENGERPAYFGQQSQVVSLLLWYMSASASLPIIVYAYLGTFSRHRGDDYCATVQLLSSGDIWQASVLRYANWSGGYSNLLFIQVGEWFARSGMVYMAAAMLILWLVGLTWMIAEIGQASGLRWNTRLSFVLAALCIIFSLYRTSNIYSILFWRSSVVGYLAPLVLMVFLVAFILYQLRFPFRRSRMIWAGCLIFCGVFIAGGASETIDALQIGILLLSLLAAYLWRKNVRKEEFVLLGIGLLSACLSMIVMALSPGNLVRMSVTSLPMPNLFSLGIETLTYGLQFIVDSFRVSPLPALLSFFLPFLLFYGLQDPLFVLSQPAIKRIKWLGLLLPIAMLIAIAFSFAPHAYARSFPSVYVRFPGLFLITITLVAEGCVCGYLLSQVTPASFRKFFRELVLISMFLLFLYPVRMAERLYERVPDYQERAVAWDARDKYIRQAVAEGATDLAVVQLDTIGGVPEYKGNEFFWVNRCAAEYYGLRSLRAP